MEDDFDFTAESHLHFIQYVLSLFGRKTSDVFCLVGDNCATNKRLADLMEVPFIGCASHRFNLEVQKFLLPYETLLTSVRDLILLHSRAFLSFTHKGK